MAHNVNFSIPERNLGKADVEFNVSANGSKIGTLKVSKGSVVWVPKDRTLGYKIGWAKFAEIMQTSGVRES